MTNILAFETSLGNCSIALSCNGTITYSESSQKMMQSEELIPMINNILSENKISYKDLGAVACSVGPGSFTGIRVGIAAALGMKKAHPRIKLIGIKTLDAIAHEAQTHHLKKSDKILAVLRSYGEEFYAQEFQTNGKSTSDIFVLSTQDLEKRHKNYSLIVSNEDLNNSALVTMNARSIVTIATNRYKDSDQNCIIEPVYVKKPNIHGHN